jgi:hypothetical protein
MSWTTTPKALTDLVENRDSGSEKELEGDWGGAQGLADSLKSDLKNGLTKQVRLYIC